MIEIIAVIVVLSFYLLTTWRAELLNKHAQTDPLIMPILEFDTLLVVNSIFGSVWRLVRWWVWFSITTKFYYYWHKRKEKEEDLEKL